ncbi:tRNA threonylcarbamoyladenosine biosynthesis protein TsaE [Panacagrimonas perspica]|uniref:tRNA threonylcarbamoyladenosine biosynthesis protein TsaE n=1 Tax=Panacagrimonas perspica TaxID=381431 RepID=A0A4S3K0K2_9GAMM|nr:tRNA (adenosine(37)-N6)-threonylcarbamoyltransferase complex ATPase subunit type 1 TsaE [Panacagrimonas perspica]TDU24417.1 tRNA threonylcarbamoyladenosine biosynthesis protein TsaE [Panacagrimonas perspica]THD01445.1 tRNA (adenosine(37)-N6)-threonylcarbamoyltransferase complex ATPase subunit type 1 TsaE [Panacagrimonas perspica]
MTMPIELPDEASTTALGERLAAELLQAGRGVVFLHGDLGAGKTTLARGLLRSCGVTGTLRSPTYTLMEPYSVGGQGFLHLDLYRLTDPSEVENLGLRDYPPESTIWLVEWPQRGAGFLPAPDLEVRLAPQGEGRVATIDRHSAKRPG